MKQLSSLHPQHIYKETENNKDRHHLRQLHSDSEVKYRDAVWNSDKNP